MWLKSKISQNVQNLGSLLKKKINFFKLAKVANWLQNAYRMVWFLENVFRPFMRFFGKKSEKFQRSKNLKNDEEGVFSQEKII